MWEDRAPTDEAVRQGDLIDLEAVGTAFPRLRLPVLRVVVDNMPTKLAMVAVEQVPLGVITSQCCTTENPVDQVGHVVTIAPVARLGWKPQHAAARLESLQNVDDPSSGTFDVHHFMLDPMPALGLRDPGENSRWVVSLARAQPFLGNHDLLLKHRLARQTPGGRYYLRKKLIALVGRATQEDARLLNEQALAREREIG